MPMTPHTISRFSGLFTSVNPVSGVVPEGAMQVADNLVLRSTNVLESRRGYYASSLAPDLGGGAPLTVSCDLANKPVPPPFSIDSAGTGATGIGPIYCSGPNGTTVDLGANVLLDGNVPLSIPGAGTYIPPNLWWCYVQGNGGIAIYNVPAGFVVSNSLDINGIANWQGYFVAAGVDTSNPGTWRAICFNGGAWQDGLNAAGVPIQPAGCYIIA